MKPEFFFVLLLASVIVLGFLATSASASAVAEKIYICAPCSRNFIPQLNAIISQLKLDDKVEVNTTRCLGYCEEPAVISFRDEIYTNMDSSKLERMLEYVFDL